MQTQTIDSSPARPYGAVPKRIHAEQTVHDARGAPLPLKLLLSTDSRCISFGPAPVLWIVGGAIARDDVSTWLKCSSAVQK